MRRQVSIARTFETSYVVTSVAQEDMGKVFDEPQYPVVEKTPSFGQIGKEIPSKFSALGFRSQECFRETRIT